MVNIVFKELNSEFIKALHNFQKLYKRFISTAQQQKTNYYISPLKKKKNTEITYN